MSNIKVGIMGAAGYTGGELLRVLLHHPQVDLAFAHSKSNAGNLIASVHRDLSGDTDLRFSSDHQADADLWFLCVGHGEARALLESTPVPDHVRIIDLSHDFRLAAHAKHEQRHFTYGLTELNRALIRSSTNIANPGCFATAIQLSLLPLAQAGVLKTVHVTGITGATGAGQSLQASLHFPWRANNISAYKTLTHQHLGEIGQSLAQISGKEAPQVHFIPWRGDFTRGIFSSACTTFEGSLEEARELYARFYSTHPFTHLSPDPIDLKQVVNTNKCLLFLEKQGDQLVIHAAIDNLLKGAVGQAVQNMNLMFGLEETCGLHLKASFF